MDSSTILNAFNGCKNTSYFWSESRQRNVCIRCPREHSSRWAVDVLMGDHTEQHEHPSLEKAMEKAGVECDTLGDIRSSFILYTR